MSYDESHLFSIGTPLSFTDGTKMYNKIAEEYPRHKKGFFILAPSGAGKTYFVKNQKEKHWIDGDLLWISACAHPKGPWWLEDDAFIKEVYAKSDIITMEARRLGFWIMGASNLWLKPDAIVVPDWETHKAYIRMRESSNYDGGATSDNFDQVIAHRERILLWEKRDVPKFTSIDQAVDFLVGT